MMNEFGSWCGDIGVLQPRETWGLPLGTRHKNMRGNIFPKMFLYTFQNNIKVVLMYKHRDGLPKKYVHLHNDVGMVLCVEGGGAIR